MTCPYCNIELTKTSVVMNETQYVCDTCNTKFIKAYGLVEQDTSDSIRCACGKIGEECEDLQCQSV